MAEFDPFKPISFDDLGDGESEDSADIDGVDIPDVDVGPDLGKPDGEDQVDDTVDPVGDAAADDVGGGIGLSDIPNEGDAGIKLDDNSSDIPRSDQLGQQTEPQVKWTNVPQDNDDIWSEHVDGYVLRARSLSAKSGSKTKYIAQLFKNKKLIEKGVVWINQGGDTQLILQNIADRILDKMGLVSHSLEPKQQPSSNQLPLDNAPNEGDIPSDDGRSGDLEGLDLGEEDMEALGG